MDVSSDVFVGRRREFGALDGQLRHVRVGQPQVCLIEGPAGIGKSALVRHWLARTTDVETVLVDADEQEAGLPYGVLVRLLAQLGGVGPGLHAGAHEDPLALGGRLVELLGTAASDTCPLVLVIDDVQWADPPSLRSLTFALRRLLADPVLTVVLARSDRVVPEVFGRLLSQPGRVTHIELEGLSGDELGELVNQVSGGGHRSFGERLREHTAGNPLHARALLRELDPSVLHQSSGPLPAPRSFAVLVAARLRACSPATVHLVEAAAVLGQRAPLGLTARVSELEDPLAALQEAVDVNLLVPGGLPVGSTVAFPHVLVRAAIYHDLGPARRSMLHLRASTFTEPPVSLDHRIAAALAENDALAEEAAAYAQQEVGCGAASSAAGHFLAAARLATSRPHREALFIRALVQLLAAGQVGRAAELAGDLDGFAPSPAGSYVAGLLAFFGGHQREAERLLSEAWERRHDGADAGMVAQACGYLAQLCSIQARTENTLAWAERSISLSGDPWVVPASSVRVCQLWLTGRSEDAFAVLTALPEQPAELTPNQVDGMLARGLLLLWSGETVAACDDLRRGVDSCRPGLASRTGLIALGYLAEAEFRRGAWDDAVAHGALSVSLAQDSDQPWATAFVNGQAALGLAGRGEWEAAAVHVGAAVAAAQALGDAASIGHAGIAACLLAYCRGDHAAVIDAVQPLLRIEHRTAVDCPGVHGYWQTLYADALVSLGCVEEAAVVLLAFEAAAQARKLPIAQSHAARVRANLEAARRHHQLAEASFDAGLELLAGRVAPFDRALLQLDYGRWLRRGGRRRLAVLQLEAAGRAFADLGAVPFAERCEREIAGSGLRPSNRSGAVARRSLTPQELAVARLVADGATNREAASQLIVSAKTVEYHLASIFRKLDVRSRTQLAAKFRDHGGPD